MSKFAARLSARVLRTRTGTINGLPRILNLDRNEDFYGYVEINTQATSPVARIKTHKAWFAPDAPVYDGDLIQDRADGKKYLVMSLKNEIDGGVCAYIDGTVYFCNVTANIERFSGATKNAFGRPAEAAGTIVAYDVPLMTTSMNMNVNEQKDQNLAEEKIKVVIQSKFDVRINDRLVCSSGSVYKVNSINRDDLVGLWVLHVDVDIR